MAHICEHPKECRQCLGLIDGALLGLLHSEAKKLRAAFTPHEDTHQKVRNADVRVFCDILDDMDYVREDPLFTSQSLNDQYRERLKDAERSAFEAGAYATGVSEQLADARKEIARLREELETERKRRSS